MTDNTLFYGKVYNAICKTSMRRGKTLTIMMLLLVLTMGAKANPVDMRQAREVGAKFVNGSTSMRTTADDLRHVTTYRTDSNTAAFYVFNMANGFVIVAADDCSIPILAYSKEGPFDVNNIPEQMEGYLQVYRKEIQYGIEHRLSGDESIAQQWDMVRSTGRLYETRSTTAVEPMLSETWNQNCYYNALCPEDPNGPCGHVYAGCVATAMGQLMHFWQYPAVGSGTHTYTPEGYPEQTADFGATTYDWANMPDNLDSLSNSTQIDAVATLLWHCGIAVNMVYSPVASGAYSEDVPYALTEYFNYSDGLFGQYKEDNTNTYWLSLIKSNLDLGMPIYYTGSDLNGSGGHAFICDGYDANDYLHFNWGWSGNGNDAYFAIDALNVSDYQLNIYNYAIFNIRPQTGNTCQITAVANLDEGGTVNGGGTYYEGSLCTLTALSDYDYSFVNWTKDGVVVSTDPTYSFMVTEDATYVANFELFEGIPVGSGTATNVYLPNYSYYCYTLSQQIYTSEDIDMAGTIISLAFYNAGETKTQVYDIYMVNTEKTYFENYYDWITPTAEDLVFSGTVTMTSGVWTTIVFDNPFVYDGTNFALIIDDNTGSWTSSPHMACRVFATESMQAMHVYGNGPNYDPLNPMQYEASALYYEKNQIRITMEPEMASTPMVNPDPIDLGYRPNGAWMLPYTLNLYNPGYYTTINSISSTDPYFQLDTEELTFPFNLGYHGNREIKVDWNTGDGQINGLLNINYGDDDSVQYNMTAHAYTPVSPDVWEMAEMVTSFPYTANLNSTTIPLYNNYRLPPTGILDGADAVYKLVFTEDTYLNASVTSGEDGKVALYTEDFHDVGGPDFYNNYTAPEIAIDDWLHYDDGNYVTSVGASGDQFWWGIKLDMEAYAGTKLTKISVYDFADMEGEIMIYQTEGTPSGEPIQRQNISLTGSSEFVELTLDTPYNVDATMPLWIVIHYISGFSYPAAVSNDSGDPNGRWISLNNSDWNDLANYGFYYTWMLRGFVTNQEGRTMAVVDGNCENITVTPGTYYLVASSTSDEWSIEINAGELPCPDPAYSPYPVNYSEVNPNRTIELSWQFGQRTTEYKLMFGTTESCEQTLVDWTRDLVRHYTLPDLIEDTTYYWKIVERNDGCSEGVESPVWSFITRLNPPQNLYAENNYIMEGESAMLYWSAPARALLSYNVYQDGVLIGNTTDTYYVVDSLGYNMDAYAFYVTGVFDAGESAPSNYAYIYVSGNGFVAGYVYEQDGSTGIENATVTFTGYDEFGYFNTFAFTTDDNGYYEGSLRAGSYQATASCTGYQSKLYEDSVLIVYNNLTEDIEIIMNELYNPVAEVIAEYYPDANDPNSQYIKVMWGNEVTENDRSLQYYRVYRTDAYYDGPYTIENTEVLSNQLYDTLFIDTSWLEADPGVYKWGVGCVYMGNRGEEIESPINWAAPLTIDNNSHVFEGTIIPAPHGQANHLGTAAIAIYMPNRGNATIGDAEKTNSDEPNSEFENLQEPRESEIVWSNFLSKDMDLINGEMNITVSLNSGDTPVGTMVTFTNLNSIEQQLYPITDIILDSTGYYAWDTFRKGDYQMTLTKEGYATITEYVSIWDTTSLSYELEEITQSPTRLYVSSTGWAKWDGLGNDLEMGDRHYEYNQVVLTDLEDNVLYTENTTNKYCQLLVDNLVEGNTYHCKVASVYSSGMTEWVETDWMYQACDNYEGVSGLIATTTEEGNLISWTYPEVSSRATRGSVAYACNVDSTNWVSYNLDNPLNATTLNNISLYGGDYCGFDGYVYATYYGNSYKIEPQTGTVVEQKPIDINYGFYDCAWDYTTHTMYGSVDQELYIWNIESNELQYIGNMGVSIEVLVCNLSGELYGIAVGSPANLYKINKANASVELVGSTGQNCSYYYQSGAIDHHTGKFYWAGYNGNSFLAEVNMVTGLATVLTTGIGHQTAFNVPFNGSLFVLGAMVYRDNELIGFTSDNNFLDEGDMDSHQYDIRVVYTGSAICPDNNTYYSMSCPQTAIMGETFEITAMTSPVGAGIIEGAGIYISGASCTLTVTPNEGYTFINWTKNDEVVSTDATYSFTVTENAAYVANFSLDSYEITATTSPEGAGIIEGAGTYTHGASCTLTVTPNEGYTFINWTKNDEVVSTDTTYSFTVTEEAAYVANFIEESVSYSITVTANPPEGGTVTGAGNYEEGQLCTLTATANENYTFVNWTKDGVEVSTDTTYSFTVTEDAAFIANFTLNQGEITQISNFSEGYNWWSTYIEQEDIEGLGMLQEGLGDNGVTIRSQASGYTDNYAGYGWYGSLSSINNESSYRVITNAPCTVTITGDAAVPSQHPITLGQGWTWIGYVPSTTMSVDAAMVGVDAVQGDRLKSQQGYADFYPGYGWYGSLNTMEPGMGLMYYSTSSNPVSFTYPDSDRGGELKKNLTSEQNHWKPNIYAYPDNMTVMAVVELDGKELSNENYELAAFAANGECRGSVKLIYAEPINRHVAFLTISGKDAAELSFRLYDTETGTEYYDVEESLGFVANAIVGEADDLYTIHFRSTTGMDEFASKVRIYPNPVNKGERFSIGMNTDVKSPVSVEIINALGTVVSVETSTQAPASIVAPITAGVYTLRISCKEGTCYRKMVVR